MTIENINAIDGAGISKKTGAVILTISDHLSWEDEESHFQLIEQKIGKYLDFVQSGQLLEHIPRAEGRAIRINIVCQYQPSDFALRFLSAAKDQLKAMGIDFSYEELPEDYR